METTSVYSYYSFGYNYHVLRGLSTKISKERAKEIFVEHCERLVELNLAVTSHIFKDGFDEVIEALEIDEEGAASDLLTIDAKNKITELLDKSDAALDSELQLKTVLSVTRKRFDTDTLLYEPQRLLAVDVWESMSEQSKNDFQEAAKCIAMNLPTASAFHLMRAVEQRLKDLYFYYVKTKRLSKPMWKPMTDKLAQKNNPKPSKETLDSLDMIRVNFRNPTQHPQKNYTIDEAQDLMNSSIVVINSIHRDMP